MYKNLPGLNGSIEICLIQPLQSYKINVSRTSVGKIYLLPIYNRRTNSEQMVMNDDWWYNKAIAIEKKGTCYGAYS